MAKNKNKIDFTLLFRVISLAKPYRLIFTLAAVLAVVLAPLAVVRPQLVKVMVDDYIFAGDIQGLAFIALIALGVLVVEGVVRYSFIYSTSWLGQSVIRDLRVNVFNKITSLKLSYFDKTPIGTSTTRTINDIESKLTFVYLIIAKKYFMPFFIEIGTFKFIDEIFIQTRIEIYLVEIKFQVKCYVML